jgi:hypothetical protein
MATVTETDCSTRDLLERIRQQVTEAKLEKDVWSQKVTDLEEHQRQVEEYDTKIKTAGDAFEKGIDAICTGFDDLRKAVDQNKGAYECLVGEDARTKISKILADLRGRRDSLRECVWKLSGDVIDKQCELDQGKVEVSREEEQLTKLLDSLDLKTKELAELKEIKEIIGCSDVVSNECRYAFYLDLEERLDVECPSAEKYVCDLVAQVEKLDTARVHVRDLEREVHVAKDLQDRVTKLRDDLVENWRDELCRAVTAGSVAKLPDEIATACGESSVPTPTTGTTTGTTTGGSGTDEPKQEQVPSSGEYQGGPVSSAPTEEA